MVKQKRGVVSLKGIKPTDEEIAEARSTIANALEPAKKAKSCMANFGHWLKEQGGELNPAALSSTGAERKRYMEEFMVWQNREKKAKIEGSTSKTVSHNTEHSLTEGWYPYIKLVAIIGHKRLVAWYKGGHIEGRVDQATQEGDIDSNPDMMDFYYTDKLKTTTYGDKTQSEATVEAKDAEGALQALKSMEPFPDEIKDGHGSRTDIAEASGSPRRRAEGKQPEPNATKAVVVKTESPEDSMVKAVLESPLLQFTRFQNILHESKRMKAKAEGEPYQEKIIEDVEKHIKRASVVVKCLEAVATGEKFNNDKLKDVCKMLPSVQAVHAKMVVHGEKFGLKHAASPAAKARGAGRGSRARGSAS